MLSTMKKAEKKMWNEIQATCSTKQPHITHPEWYIDSHDVLLYLYVCEKYKKKLKLNFICCGTFYQWFIFETLVQIITIYQENLVFVK